MSNENRSSVPNPNVMDAHPAREEWMAYLYEEIDSQRQVALREHLRTCSACREQVAGWEGMRQSLDKWKAAPPVRKRRVPVQLPRRWQLPWRWAAAAAFVLFLGFLAGWGTGAGRAGGPSAEWTENFRAALKAELKEELQAEGVVGSNSDIRAAARAELEEWLAEYHALRQVQDQAFIHALDELEARHDAQLTQLRRELETVALVTEETFRQAQWRITQLAAWAEGGMAE
jgi:hypothetical protein